MAPTFAFPAPVLAVAADAVRELEGGEALTGLWTLFTKCKASLKDGHRLENISWRLWYREMAINPRPGLVSESECEKEGPHRWLDEKAPLVREEQDTQPDVQFIPSTHAPLPAFRIPVTSPPPHPQLPTVVAHAATLTRRTSCVGRIIVDMLPNPLPPSQPRQNAPPEMSTTSSYPSQPLSSHYPTPASNGEVADTHSLAIRCHLPTPAGSKQYLMPPSIAEEVHTEPEPIVQVHVEPAPPATPPSTLPQLVIVHPTPGPTPHPTPPATPILGLSTSCPRIPEESVPAPSLPSPKFTLRAKGSTTSSSSDSSSVSGRTAVSSTTSSSATTSTDSATAAESKSAATLASASSANLTAPPPPSNTITQAKTSPAPMVRKSHSTPASYLPPDVGPSSRARPRAQGHIRQTSSASSVGGGKAKEERSKSKSRSRSRGADGPRVGLTMTTAIGKRGGAAVGGGQRGRAVGLRKTSSRTGVTGGGRAITRDKRPTFNIGSHSDDVGSKSAGSGSSVSGPTNAAQQPPKPHHGGLAPPQRQQSATRLMPPPALPLRPLPDASALLPPKQQQPRRTIVLATSESDESDDYETETDLTGTESEHADGAQHPVEDEGDTGDWSSESMSTDDVEVPVRRSGAAQPGSGHEKKGHIQQQHRNHSTAIIANNHHHTTTTTTSNNRTRQQQQYPQAQPHHAQHPHVPLSRAQQSRRNHAANAQYVVEQAALEATRIREMFAKKPVPSSEDLQAQRTRSVGLLTQLMNPDPQIFPPSHPYRRGHSSGDMKNTGVRLGGTLGGGGLTMTKASSNGSSGGERGPVGLGQAPMAKRQTPQRRASAGPAPGLRLSKSSAAIPVASQVQVGSVPREPSQESSGTQSGKGALPAGSGASGGYRPKGRPADQEMEDTESEGEGGETNGILVSKSVAQEKLKALAARRGIVPLERKGEEADPVPNWLREPESASGKGGRTTSPEALYLNNNATSSSSRHSQQQQRHATLTPTPIPVGHPYNLPPPAAPSTPRTTRRLMLQTEMSESLRRNLLWERQVSKVSLVGFRRSASGGGSGRGGGTVLGGGLLKPLTAMPNVVQVTAKQPGVGGNEGSSSRERDRERERRGSGGAMEGDVEREDRKKKALARNRSWANEFHYTGW